MHGRAQDEKADTGRRAGGPQAAQEVVRRAELLDREGVDELFPLPGDLVPRSLRGPVEAATGRDLSHVRVHHDAHADALARAHGAAAFAIGADIGFRSGRWRPDTPTGQLLAAHELAHAAQQARAAGAPAHDTGSAAAELDADRVAFAAAAGARAVGVRPSPRGLALNLCRIEPTHDRAELAQIARRHLRLVPEDTPETFGYTSPIQKHFVVRASEEPRDTDDFQPGDVRIRFGRGYPRVTHFEVVMPGGYRRPSSPTTSGAGIVAPGAAIVHFPGHGTYRLTAYVQISPTMPLVTVERTITVTQSIADVRARFPDESAAAAQALGEEPAPDLRASLDELAAHRALLRGRARELDVIGAGTLDAWFALDNLLLAQRGRLEAGRSPSDPAEVRRALASFVAALEQETQPDAVVRAVSAMELVLRLPARVATSAGVLAAWVGLARAFDAWLAERLRAGEAEGSGDVARALEYALGAEREQRRLVGKTHLTRVPAVFHPRQAYVRAGGIIEVPHVFYTWVEDGRWHLRDITNPEQTFTYDIAYDDERAPPRALFAEVNNREHFTTGLLHYRVPGEARATLEVTSPWAWSDYLQVFALALLGAGLILVTMGAAAPPIVAATGGYFLAGAAVVGAAAAGVHMYEAAQRGRLTTTTALVDVAQIVASLASAGVATIATRAGSFGLQALSRGQRAVYLGLSGSALTGDVVAFGVISYEGFQQLYKLWRQGASAGELDRAASLLLLNLSIQGLFVSMSARNTVRDFRPGQRLEVDVDADGMPVLRNPDAPAPVAGAAPATTGGPAGERVTIAVPAAWHDLPDGRLPAISGHSWSRVGPEWQLFRDPATPPIALAFNVYHDPVSGALNYNVRTQGRLVQSDTRTRPAGDTYQGSQRLPPSLEGTGQASPYRDAQGRVWDKGHGTDFADTRPGLRLSATDPANFDPQAIWWNRGARNHLVQRIRKAGGGYREMALYDPNPPVVANGQPIPREFIFVQTGPSGEFVNAWRVPNDPAITDRSLAAVSPFTIAQAEVPTAVLREPPSASIDMTSTAPPPARGVVVGFRGRLEESAEPEGRPAQRAGAPAP